MRHSRGDECRGKIPRRGDGEGSEKTGSASSEEQTGVMEEETPSDSGSLEERGCVCEERDDYQEEDEEGVQTQLLSRSSVAVSTSQDFDDNATITAFWGENKQKKIVNTIPICSRHRKCKRSSQILTFSKPMAQSLSILRVYSGLETGAPA